MKYKFDVKASEQVKVSNGGILAMYSYPESDMIMIFFHDSGHHPARSTCVMSVAALSHLYDHLCRAKCLDEPGSFKTMASQDIASYTCITESKRKDVYLYDKTTSVFYQYSFSYLEAQAILDTLTPVATELTPEVLTPAEATYLDKLQKFFANARAAKLLPAELMDEPSPGCFESMIRKLTKKKEA